MKSLDKYDRAVVRQLQDQVEGLAITIAGVKCVLPGIHDEIEWFGHNALEDLRTLVRIALGCLKMELEAPDIGLLL